MYPSPPVRRSAPSLKRTLRTILVVALFPTLLGSFAPADAGGTTSSSRAVTATRTHRAAVTAPGSRKTARRVVRKSRRTSGRRVVRRSTSRRTTSLKKGRRLGRRTFWGRHSKRHGRRARHYRPATRWTLMSSTGEVGPWVYSASALLVNVVSGTVLFQHNADVERPVASLTKLMTALTFLDTHPDLGQMVLVQRSDVYGANVTRLRAGEVLRLGDALHAALMVSDNAAARVLARHAGGGSQAAFVAMMNERAHNMGLVHTHFTEPTGLDRHNISTAREIAAMMTASSHDSTIASVMRKSEYAYRSSRRYHHFGSTNRLLASRWEVRGGKTGYTSPAGYCLATCIADGSGREFAGVVLGAPSGATRFADVSRMMNWAANH